MKQTFQIIVNVKQTFQKYKHTILLFTNGNVFIQTITF